MMIDPRDRRGKRLAPILSQHAEVIVLEDKAAGRRAQRNPMHERFRDRHRITEDEFDAVEGFVSDYAFVSRSSLSSMLGRMEGGGSGDGPSDAVLMATTRVRLAVQRMGIWRTPMLVDACCDAMTTMAMARKHALHYENRESGAAREWVEDMVLTIIRLLAGTTPQDIDLKAANH
jgi:hypothetical protein